MSFYCPLCGKCYNLSFQVTIEEQAMVCQACWLDYSSDFEDYKGHRRYGE